MKLDEIQNPAVRKQVEDKLKAARESELPALLEAAREMCDAADAPRLERDLLRQCCHDLSRLDVPYLHLSPKAREKAGWPDLCFAYKGRAFMIELKKAKGVVSDAQKATLAKLAKQGAVTAVVRNFSEWRTVTGITGGEG